MGTTGFMAMHRYRPDLAARVRLAGLLAPVASEANMGGPLGWLAGLGIDGILDVGSLYSSAGYTVLCRAYWACWAWESSYPATS